ncbi:hypothetical protein [Chryseobacterium indoltheticum]|uniref:hypothetical protein n=1 Tax=Chryseobacterium indoltheticum TaxID=254 RepID=UPI003F499B91
MVRLSLDKVNAISQIIGIPTYNYQSFKRGLELFLYEIPGFQYAYDVISDLVDTYSEIIRLLLEQFTKCFPDFVSFQNMLCLGNYYQINSSDSIKTSVL